MRVQNFLLPRLEARHHRDPAKGSIDGLSQKDLKFVNGFSIILKNLTNHKNVIFRLFLDER
jgi:hypothetical protein